jgi:hypothetical protein
MSLLSCILVEFVMLLPMKLLDTRHAIGMTETPVAGPASIVCWSPIVIRLKLQVKKKATRVD